MGYKDFYASFDKDCHVSYRMDYRGCMCFYASYDTDYGGPCHRDFFYAFYPYGDVPYHKGYTDYALSFRMDCMGYVAALSKGYQLRPFVTSYLPGRDHRTSSRWLKLKVEQYESFSLSLLGNIVVYGRLLRLGVFFGPKN